MADVHGRDDGYREPDADLGMAPEDAAEALGPVKSLDAFLAVLGFALWCLVVLRIVKD